MPLILYYNNGLYYYAPKYGLVSLSKEQIIGLKVSYISGREYMNCASKKVIYFGS